MNYAVGCAFNLDDAFINFNTKKLNLTGKDCINENCGPNKTAFVKKVFRESIKMIINDIIENNVTFELPTGAKKSDIHMVKIEGDKFKEARQRGKFKDVDFLQSWFSGNQIMFNIYSKGRTRQKPIYLNKELKDKITQYTNKGKQYC